MNQISVNGILSRQDANCAWGNIHVLSVARKSNKTDSLLVMSHKKLPEGPVHIEGMLHAEYIHGIGVPPFIVPFIVEAGEADGHSAAAITGRLKAKPICRRIRQGLPIASIKVVTEGDGTIPAILWGDDAAGAENLHAGCLVEAEGRMQSREYQDRHGKAHITYELSVRRFRAISEDQA